MPDVPELEEELRSLADSLERRSRPVDPDAAMVGGAIPPPRRRASLAIAAAALLLLSGVALAATLANSDDGDVVVSGGTEPTMGPTTSVPFGAGEGSYSGVRFEELPEAGVAVAHQNGVTLLSFDGDELGSVGGLTAGDLVSGGAAPLLLRPGGIVEVVDAVVEVDRAEAPPGCERAEGAGAVRVALCEDEEETTSQVVSVSPGGETVVLAGPPPAAGADGTWSRATPAPAGAWALAQWSDRCQAAGPYLVAADGSDVRPALAADDSSVVDASALGWSPDGRAAVRVGAGMCDAASPEPGVYLVDPTSNELSLVASVEVGVPVSRWERRVDASVPERVPERLAFRAFEELGLAACCGEPAHGADTATTGVAWEDFEVPVSATPAEDPPFVPFNDLVLESTPGEIAGLPVTEGEADLGAFVAFTCGGHVWALGGAGAGDRTPIGELRSLAETLIPHLYCTVGSRPEATGHA